MIKEKILKMALEFENRSLYRVIMVSGITLVTMIAAGDLTFAVKPLPGGGEDGEIVSRLTEGTTQLFIKITKLSHPAAAFGIGVGAIMKKFSMGRQDRVETGNKLIRESVIGWGTINGINAIIGSVEDIMSPTV